MNNDRAIENEDPIEQETIRRSNYGESFYNEKTTNTTPSITQRFYDLDKRGVRAFVGYSEATGKYKIECYRKKTKTESTGEGDWQMIRVGSTLSYETRPKAEEKAIELAEQIAKEFNY